MLIQPFSNQTFRGGSIIVHESGSQIVNELDTDKILKIEARNDDTLIIYDRPKETRHNGYTYNTPTSFMLKQDINTVLNAYNATKNSNLKVDITEYGKY